MSATIATNAEQPSAELAYHDPKQAPTLARLEQLVGHPVDAAKFRARLDATALEVAPVQTLGASGPSESSEPPTPRVGWWLISVGAGPASYEHRAELKSLHLRWDPAAREWSGIILGEDIATLEGLGLAVEVRQRREPREPEGSAPAPKRDYAKASVEAYGARGVQGRESAQYSLLEVTAGLPDDSREGDERARAKVEAEREGRVAAAMAALEAHLVARAQVFHDQTRCAMFCARYGVSPADICPYVEDLSARVVAPGSLRDGMCTWCHTWHGWNRPVDVADVEEVMATPADWLSEVRAREAAVLPGSEWGDG